MVWLRMEHLAPDYVHVQDVVGCGSLNLQNKLCCVRCGALTRKNEQIIMVWLRMEHQALVSGIR